MGQVALEVPVIKYGAGGARGASGEVWGRSLKTLIAQNSNNHLHGKYFKRNSACCFL